MTEEVVGFTQNQRAWFLERDGHQCQFYSYDGNRWVRCKCKIDLQVHHIIPRGWARFHMPHNFQLNGSMNGITLCKAHHVGKISVHPDTFNASVEYHRGFKTAYDDMMQRRKALNLKGIPYWDTRWDMSFSRICRKQTLRFIRAHPYPMNGNRGNTGRL